MSQYVHAFNAVLIGFFCISLGGGLILAALTKLVGAPCRPPVFKRMAVYGVNHVSTHT